MRRKKLWDLLLFLVMNVLINLVDLITDGFTAYYLWEVHIFWSVLTIFWMFSPFFLNLLIIFLKQRKNQKFGLKESFLHFPLCVPVKNSFLMHKLYKVKYSDSMPVASMKEVEEIKMEAGKLSQTEAFMESGPQLILQLHIILCTGHMKNTQLISIIVSLLSLSVAACRAFFIQRDQKRSDPEPSLHMFTRVLPSMMVVLFYNVVSWTFITGILKGWTFCVIFFVFIICFFVHKVWDQMDGGKVTKSELEPVEMLPMFSEKKHGNDSQEHGIQDNGNFFSVKAAVLGLWIPCVVGKTEYSFWLVSVTSFITRTSAVLLACLLANLNIVPTGTFLLHCTPFNETSGNLTHDNSCYKLSQCFKQVNEKAVQKQRICPESNDDNLINIIAVAVMIISIFSIVATFLLNKMTDYEHLFNVSKSCCWMGTCPVITRPEILNTRLLPTIHRNIIFTVLEKNEDEEGAEKLRSIFGVARKNKEALKELTSRPLDGETPLIVSVKQRKVHCATVLLNEGAKIEDNANGEDSLHIACANGDLDMVNVILEHGGEIKEKASVYPLNIAVNSGSNSIVEVLLSKDAQIQEDSHGEHPLLTAVNNNDSRMVNTLLHRIMKMDNRRIKSHIPESKHGIIHTTVNQTLFTNLLQNDQLEMKRKLNLIFKLKKVGVTTIPSDNFDAETMNTIETKIEDWNTACSDEEHHLYIRERKLFKDEQTMDVTKPTNDMEISLGGKKNITGLELKWCEDRFIHRLRVRYEDGWGEKHKTGEMYNGETKMFLSLKKGEVITAINTRYDVDYGNLVFFNVTTSSGRSWGKNAGNSYETKAGHFTSQVQRLAYISSARGLPDQVHYQTVFHWI